MATSKGATVVLPTDTLALITDGGGGGGVTTAMVPPPHAVKVAKERNKPGKTSFFMPDIVAKNSRSA